MSRDQADQVALAVDKPIPRYMKYGRDNYIPLDMPHRSQPVIGWPYWAAAVLTVCCVAFVVCSYFWRG